MSKRLYNPFTQKFVLEAQFESSDGESDTNDDRTKKTALKKAVMMEMGKWSILIYKLLIFLGMMHHKSLCPRVTRRTLHLDF